MDRAVPHLTQSVPALPKFPDISPVRGLVVQPASPSPVLVAGCTECQGWCRRSTAASWCRVHRQIHLCEPSGVFRKPVMSFRVMPSHPGFENSFSIVHTFTRGYVFGSNFCACFPCPLPPPSYFIAFTVLFAVVWLLCAQCPAFCSRKRLSQHA